MVEHTEWKDTAPAGFAIEEAIAKEFGLRRNEDVTGTDLVSDAGTYVEVKSIGSRAIEYNENHIGDPTGPKYMLFQITRKAKRNDENLWFPVIRPGGVFRTCYETPNSMIVVRSPEKRFYDLYTERNVVVPERTFYYRSGQLLTKLMAMIYTGQATVQRLRPTEDKYGFETIVKVEFNRLSHIELSRTEFVARLGQQNNEIMTSATAHELWIELVHRHVIPCLRQAPVYLGKFGAFLQMDPDPMWRPSWWTER